MPTTDLVLRTTDFVGEPQKKKTWENTGLIADWWCSKRRQRQQWTDWSMEFNGLILLWNDLVGMFMHMSHKVFTKHVAMPNQMQQACSHHMWLWKTSHSPGLGAPGIWTAHSWVKVNQVCAPGATLRQSNMVMENHNLQQANHMGMVEFSIPRTN